MSLGNFSTLLETGFVGGGSGGQKCFNSPEGYTLVFATSAPTGAGYAPGCIFINTSSGIAYRNSGSKASCTWTSISASAASTSLANGCTLNDAGALDAILAFTQQTVSAPTLTIPDFAGAADSFAFITLAQVLDRKSVV